MELTNSYPKTVYELVDYLNKCRDSYYNHNISLITDEQYDDLFDELQKMEEESGIILSNSPTQSVGYPVAKDIPTIKLAKPLLSLEKTKLYDDIRKFSTKPVLFMHKLDGLTSMLTYQDGKLVQMCTRGDGIEGRDITHNACAISGIPNTIPYKGTVYITGECIMKVDTWERYIQENRDKLDSDIKKSNPRNLASGSVSQKDSSICAQRGIMFIAWNANDLSTDGTMMNGFKQAEKIGFKTVHRYLEDRQLPVQEYERIFENMRKRAVVDNLPIDGIVVMYDDIKYGESLGRTEHHFKNGKAFKFYEDEYNTTVTGIEYTIGKTGVLTPTVIFEPKEIDGTSVSRASVHNISILKKLNLCIGDDIDVYKADEIIPQVKRNNTKHADHDAFRQTIPKECPYCKSHTSWVYNDDVITLECSNPDCSGRKLKLISYFTCKTALDIDGLSEKTLEKFINMGFISTYKDVFNLVDVYGSRIKELPGFGEKTVDNLRKSLEKAKHTTLDKVLVSFSIENIGKVAARQLSGYFHNDPEELIKQFKERSYVPLSDIEGFGGTISLAVNKWFHDENNMKQFEEIVALLDIGTKEESKSNELQGVNFVITGSLTQYKNRQELVNYIESCGGTVQSGVTKDTTYLINNDSESSSSKNKKAKELGIPIITEMEFIERFGKSVKSEDETVKKSVETTEETPKKNVTPKSNKRRLF